MDHEPLDKFISTFNRGAINIWNFWRVEKPKYVSIFGKVHAFTGKDTVCLKISKDGCYIRNIDPIYDEEPDEKKMCEKCLKKLNEWKAIGVDK